LLPPVRPSFLGDRYPRGDELLQVPGTDPNRVVDPDVRQFAVLTELVDRPRADGQPFGDIRYAQKAIPTAIQERQVGRRGRRGSAWRSSRGESRAGSFSDARRTNPTLFGPSPFRGLGSKTGSKIFGFFCERLGWLD
jgi:hypothetical protein